MWVGVGLGPVVAVAGEVVGVGLQRGAAVGGAGVGAGGCVAATTTVCCCTTVCCTTTVCGTMVGPAGGEVGAGVAVRGGAAVDVEAPGAPVAAARLLLSVTFTFKLSPA